MTDQRDLSSFLLCRCGEQRCALPLADVVETLRPLPIEPVRGGPEVVLGLAMIRGEPVPVVDATRLLGLPAVAPARFVLCRVGERRVALAVTEVVGVRTLPLETFAALPPLLSQAGSAIDAIALLDRQLLVVLAAARLLAEPAA